MLTATRDPFGVGVGFGYIFVHLISIGYISLHKKLGFKYQEKDTRLVILVPQLLLLLLTIVVKARGYHYNNGFEGGYLFFGTPCML